MGTRSSIEVIKKQEVKDCREGFSVNQKSLFLAKKIEAVIELPNWNLI